ncbi:MAG TPA: metalloregulator ArsR/SmtB family transcription factor [Acidobacteriota bacterium]|nr:metalloregulator ArsR/SmtB family transcription factor [Acidobacteriota bacterium]
MSVKDAVKVFKALADPTRLRIMLLLRVRELCVCELTYILGMEQSRVSRHMRVLRDAGLTEDVRQGRWMIYRIPAGSRARVDGLFAGLGRARPGRPGGRGADARKLAACVRLNMRGGRGAGRPCGARP